MTYNPRAENTVVLHMSQEEVEEAFSGWTDEMQTAALKEGWDLWDSRGSVSGPIQVCRVDDPEAGEFGFHVPYLDSDDTAMLLVMRGSGIHHLVAREIVKKWNPEDYMRMCFVLESSASKETP